MKKIVKRTISSMLSAGLILMQIPSTVYAHTLYIDSERHEIEISEENINYATAAAIETLEKIQDEITKEEIELELFTDKELPKMVDLTKKIITESDSGESLYMPEVGNQGEEGTAVLFLRYIINIHTK